jgi:hypothetical protein
VQRGAQGHYLWLHKGRAGSLQTAAEMGRLVRQDTVHDEGLERYAAGVLINAGLDSHSAPADVVDVLFRAVQRIPYIYDPAGSFDSIQSARRTLEKGYGDCDDLSVALATLLSLVGVRPRFVLARYKENTAGFDHVYVEVDLPEGRTPLDPSSRSHGMGWEKPAIEKLSFPIFAGTINDLGFLPGAAAGAAFAVPVWGQIALGATMLIKPILSLFSRKEQRAEETARDQWKEAIYDGMIQLQTAVDSCQITPDDGVAAARKLVAAYYQQCDNFRKKSVAASCRNFETQDYPGGAQQGGFRTHEANIQSAGKSCQTQTQTQTLPSGARGETAGSGAPGVGGMSSLSTVLLIGAALYLLTR